MKDSLLQHDTVALNAAKDALHIIDQTKLPGELVFLDLRTQAEIWNAIQTLQVRGAPAIGVAAAYGLYLAAREIQATDADDFRVKLHDAAEYLASSRPTAVNLLLGAGADGSGRSGKDAWHTIRSGIRAKLLQESRRTSTMRIFGCAGRLAEYGLELVQPWLDGIADPLQRRSRWPPRSTAPPQRPSTWGRSRGYHFCGCLLTRPGPCSRGPG